MNSCLSREKGRTYPRSLPFFAHLLGVTGVLLFVCTIARAAEQPSFSPLPEQPSFTLTNGIILVSPSRLYFGAVPKGKSVTNTFLVENFGHGKLVGKATVHAPFKIISGAKYTLKEKEVQVVEVVYTAEHAGEVDTATVTFTGGNGAKAMVRGKALD